MYKYSQVCPLWAQCVATDVRQNTMTEQKKNLADSITSIIGSWKFLIIQSFVLVCYIIINAYVLEKPFDPYPFILLNLVLSFQAAYTAPVILMSHNRMSEKDRELAQIDRENTRKILLSIQALENTLKKEVDAAIDEITEAVNSEEEN